MRANLTLAIADAFDKSPIMRDDVAPVSLISLHAVNNILAANAGRLCEDNPGDIFRHQKDMETWVKASASTPATAAKTKLAVFAFAEDAIHNEHGMTNRVNQKSALPYRKILVIKLVITPAEPGTGPDGTISYQLKDITEAFYTKSKSR